MSSQPSPRRPHLWHIYYAATVREDNHGHVLVCVRWFHHDSKDPVVTYLRKVPGEPIEPAPTAKSGTILVSQKHVYQHPHEPFAFLTKEYWINQLKLVNKNKALVLQHLYIDIRSVPCMKCFLTLSRCGLKPMHWESLLEYLKSKMCVDCAHMRKAVDPRLNKSA
jgi:hypothetical protein